ncbi:MAG: WD40/YVTN/BNR-like repeat-containing protein [Blastocatellales bacterium]
MRENREQTRRQGDRETGEKIDGDRGRLPVSLRLFRNLFFVLLACSFFLPTSPSRAKQQAEWGAQSSGVLSKLSGVYFVDRNRGWVVGSNGTLLVTEDGGVKWRRQELPERQKNEALNDVWFLNSGRGLLLGEYGIFNRKAGADWSERIFLLTSNDRGANWEAGALARLPIKQPIGQPESVSSKKTNEGIEVLKPEQRPSDPILLRMVFANDQTGWAVGEAGTIQSTDDGGATWRMQEASERKLLYDVAAIDGKQAWAVGAGGTILRTVDGGRNWKGQSSGAAQTLRGVHFIDAKRGWAVGAKGTIITTINGGGRWHRQTSNVELNLNDIFFVNAKEGSKEEPKEGWIAGDRGLLLHTTDGGATWESVGLSTHANLSRLFFVAPDYGWVVGTSGAIFKYGQIENPQK